MEKIKEQIDELKEYRKKLSKLTEEESRKRDLYLKQLADGTLQGPPTGYSSIDKSWLQYYSNKGIDSIINPDIIYRYMKKANINNINNNAINYFGKHIKYGKMFEKIDEATKALIHIGIKKGDVVTMVMANIPENIYLFYAINRLGAISNIIDPRLKNEEIIEILNDCNSKCLISLDVNIDSDKVNEIRKKTSVKDVVLLSPVESLPLINLVNNFKNIKSKKFDNCYFTQWKQFLSCGKKETIVEVEYENNMPCIMVRTGGTTGKSKTVVLSNDSLNQLSFQHKVGDYNFNTGDTFLNFLPPFIAYGICAATHLPLSLGLEDILIPTFSAEDFPKLMRKYKPNIVFGGPILYEKLMTDNNIKNIDLSSFNVPVSGGDTMLPELERQINEFLEQHGCEHKVGQGYGMTEVSSSVCYSKENARTPGSVGIPLIKSKIAIFDPEIMEEMHTEQEGEICIQTDTMMLGYLNNDKETSNVIRTHLDGTIWVHTGDIGYMDKKGRLFVKGRMKRMIVSNGSKIFPSEVENIINKNPNVLASAVVGIDDPEKRKVPIANIVLVDGATDNVEKIIADVEIEIKKTLPDFYMPVSYVIRKQLPLTSINKIDFKSLENDEYDRDSRISYHIDDVKKIR